MQNVFSFLKSPRGFTLVELLVVMSMISFLSSVTLSSTNVARMNARDSQRIAQINEVSKALELYYDSNGRYPDFSTHEPTDVPLIWQHMIRALNNKGFITATFSYANYNKKLLSLFVPSQALAMVGPYYYSCSIQDPLYRSAEDYLNSYSYVGAPDGEGYILRVKLENLDNVVLKTSPVDNDWCNSLDGFYCREVYSLFI